MKRKFCPGKSLSAKHHQPLVSTIMEKVVNGTEVIEAGLNSCIIATTESANSIDFSIKIDFLKLFGRKTKRQCCVMEEILDLSSNFDSARELIKHPVIAAFIWAKWEKSKKYYYLHALIYMAFLLFYSVMVYQLFGGGGDKAAWSTLIAPGHSRLCSDWLRSAWSTLIGLGMSRLGSHWSKCC